MVIPSSAGSAPYQIGFRPFTIGAVEPVNAEALDGFAMLEGVGLTARRELIASAIQMELAPHDLLIEQGTRHAKMFLVLEGELGVHLDSPDADPVATIGKNSGCRPWDRHACSPILLSGSRIRIRRNLS